MSFSKLVRLLILLNLLFIIFSYYTNLNTGFSTILRTGFLPFNIASEKFALGIRNLAENIFRIPTVNSDLAICIKKLEVEEEQSSFYKSIIARQTLNPALTPEVMKKTKSIVAQVYAHSLSGKDGFFYINVGSSDGVYPEFPVFIGNTILGVIKKVESNSSQVLPLTNSELKLPISVVHGGELVKGTTVGELNVSIKLENMLKDDIIGVNDDVITLATKTIPAGMIVGKVLTSETFDNEIVRNVTVVPNIDFDKVVDISVIIP